MKNKYLRALMSFVIIGSMAVSLMACGEQTDEEVVQIDSMEAEESLGISFDLIGGKDVMPIAGYNGPSNFGYSYDGQNVPELATEEVVKLLADCGVNVIISNNIAWNENYEEVKNLLDWGEQHKVGMLVKRTALKGNSTSRVNEMLAEFINHPACCGLYLVDEPGGTTYFPDGGNGGVFADHQEISRMLADELDIFYYCNLIKVTSLSQKSAYEQYIQEYIDVMHPQFLSYDYYPFDHDTRNDRPRYFWNLAIIREYALKNNLPFWNFVQAGIIVQNDERTLTLSEGEHDWGVNMSLAFGAQGIEYFPLIQPTEFSYRMSADGKDMIFDFSSRGLIGAWGNINYPYYYAQDMNKQVAEVDDVLMNAVSKGVIAAGEQATADSKEAGDTILKGTSWRELKDVHGDAMVGCFNYQGKTALYVVNYDTEYAQDITLDFYDTYKIRVSHLAETEYMETDCLTIPMEAGDGALIVFE